MKLAEALALRAEAVRRIEHPRLRLGPRRLTRPGSPAGTVIRSRIPASGNYRGGSGFRGVFGQLSLPQRSATAGSSAQMGRLCLTGQRWRWRSWSEG